MSIYVDELFGWPLEFVNEKAKKHGECWCHLWCDPGEEEKLHSLAQSIGLKRAWFQNTSNFSHYDLVPNKRRLAIKAGAQEINMRDWLKERMGAC